jgi:hypothetical protein
VGDEQEGEEGGGIVGNLLLEGEDGGDAAVDGIGEARLGLVADGEHSVAAARHGNVEQQLGHIAGAEDFMHGGEARGALLRPEVGREDAAAHALPPQELAGPAWGSAAHGGRRVVRPLSPPLPQQRSRPRRVPRRALQRTQPLPRPLPLLQFYLPRMRRAPRHLLYLVPVGAPRRLQFHVNPSSSVPRFRFSVLLDYMLTTTSHAPHSTSSALFPYQARQRDPLLPTAKRCRLQANTAIMPPNNPESHRGCATKPGVGTS